MCYSQPKKLAFVDDGTTLLHSSLAQPAAGEEDSRKGDSVVAWNLTAAQPRYTCPGSLIGISRDGSTLLTHRSDDREEGGVSAWSTATGAEIPLDTLAPDDYDLRERALISTHERSQLTLQIQDVLGGFPLTSFPIIDDSAPGSGGFLDTWAMSPNGQYMIATLSGDRGGFDWANGISLSVAESGSGLSVGEEVHHFEVNRFQGDPPLNFSEEHHLLAISNSNGCFAVYDLSQWKILREVWVNGLDFVVAFHPRNKWRVAVSTMEYGKQLEPNRFYVVLLDITSPTQEGAVVRRGKVESIIQETGRIDGLLFRPDGKQLVSLLADQTLHVWDVSRGKLVTTLIPM